MGRSKKFNFRKTFFVEYQALTNAIHRCHNPDHSAFPNYGARGIQVCEAWRSKVGFYLFLEHVGQRPSPLHSLDRIDNDGHYEPGNVRWTDRKTQQNNRRSFRADCQDLGWGVGYTAPTARGPRRSALVPYKGSLWTIVEAARDAGMRSFTVRQRLMRGMTPEDVFSLPTTRFGQTRKSSADIRALVAPSNPTIN